jgi:hypothetical protein
LVVKDSNLPRPFRGKETRKKLARFAFPKDILFYTPQEIDDYKNIPVSFVSEILETGKVLYKY